jgi:hypothetical protein
MKRNEKKREREKERKRERERDVPKLPARACLY